MDGTALMVTGLLFSSAGIGYYIYGRRQDLLLPKYCGLVLLVYPYFAPDLYWLLGIGAGLLALPYLLRD